MKNQCYQSIIRDVKGQEVKKLQYGLSYNDTGFISGINSPSKDGGEFTYDVTWDMVGETKKEPPKPIRNMPESCLSLVKE